MARGFDSAGVTVSGFLVTIPGLPGGERPAGTGNIPGMQAGRQRVRAFLYPKSEATMPFPLEMP
jgi:hypothetical protein